MTGCHNCPHAAAIATGKYKNTPWNKTPCATCQAADPNDQPLEYQEWRRTTAIDADPATGIDLDAPSTPGPEEEHLPLSVLREVIAGLLDLPPAMRDVISWRYAGMTYADIAKLQGVTRQCIELRHRRAIERWPVLSSLFPEKAVKEDRRQRKPTPRTRKEKQTP